MFGIGIPELTIIAVVVFFLFGGAILKRLITNAATGIREGRQAVAEIKSAIDTPA